MEKYDIIGYPRLVRLNPNIPWKTRGNGAISIQVGKEGKKKIKIGEINGKDIVSSLKLTRDLEKSDNKKIKNIVKEIVEKNARIEDENTNPGFVILKDQPNGETYKKSVTQIVTIAEIKSFLSSIGADFEGYKNSRGLIGATSAIAWSPLLDRTYELISYRQQRRWGTKRDVDSYSVKKMDTSCKTTFDNFDYENKHNRLVPNSPCPILYGIRGDDVKDLMKAYSIVESELVDSWLIFETNQGTDDHLQKKNIADIQSYQSVILRGLVVQNPYTLEGGHVIMKIKDTTGTIDCAAYEPTKEFRNVIRNLYIGDVVEVYGSISEQPLTLNIEKINVEHLTTIFEKLENPVCPNCGKHMKSKGMDQGYKCKICGTKSDKPIVRKKKRIIHTGFYEVPVCARRHLSKPLKRMYR
ncbi:MAG: DUF1743 domain-containing protein [Thermoplasmatales archaeon]|nr:MAG: DUF1743 domain-containing protein [Thermoplasmatales archaeon]